MDLLDRIFEDLKNALRQGDALRVSVLRMLAASIRNREIEKRTKFAKAGKPPEPLTGEEMAEAVVSEAKKRREAIEGFEKGGRQDLAEQEKKELAVLGAYLPEQFSEVEVAAAIDEAIRATGASGAKDIGKVMGY